MLQYFVTIITQTCDAVDLCAGQIRLKEL
jgi:hypothetical protein